MQPELEMRFHESGFIGFFKDGEPIRGHHALDDLQITLECIAAHFGFTVKDGPEMSYDDIEKYFA